MLAKVMCYAWVAIVFLTSAEGALLVTGEDLSYEEKKEIDGYLRKYTSIKADLSTWSPKEKELLLESDQEFADLTFMRGFLKEKFPNRQIQIAYVPDTVWNLAAIYDWHSEKRRDIRKRFPMTTKSGGVTDKDIVRTLYFDISASLFKKLKNDNIQSTEFYQDLAQKYLKKLSSLKECIFEDEETSDSVSLLMSAIDQELKASKKNEILLFRGTQGFLYKSHLAPPEEYKARLNEQLEIWDDDPSVVAGMLQKYILFYENNKNNKAYCAKGEASYILDYPGYGQGSSVLECIENLDKDKFPSTTPLSYADSFLAGWIFDKMACTYYYSSFSRYTYALSVNKKSFYNSRHFYALPNSLSTDGIVSGQETFHPRLKKIESAYPQGFDCYHTISPLTIDATKPVRDTINQYTLAHLDRMTKPSQSGIRLINTLLPI